MGTETRRALPSRSSVYGAIASQGACVGARRRRLTEFLEEALLHARDDPAGPLRWVRHSSEAKGEQSVPEGNTPESVLWALLPARNGGGQRFCASESHSGAQGAAGLRRRGLRLEMA